jgi:hypothetical protein
MTFRLLEKARMFVRSFHSTLRFFETSELDDEATEWLCSLSGCPFSSLYVSPTAALTAAADSPSCMSSWI